MTTISDGTTTITPQLVLGWESSSASNNIFHTVIGRSDPDVTLRGLATPTGTLKLLFVSQIAANACLALHQQAKTFVVTDSDITAANMTYAVAGVVTVTLDEETRAVWTVTVPFQVVTP